MDILFDSVDAFAEKFTMPSRKRSREQRLADRLLRGASKGALTDAKAIIQEGAQVSRRPANSKAGPRLIQIRIM